VDRAGHGFVQSKSSSMNKGVEVYLNKLSFKAQECSAGFEMCLNGKSHQKTIRVEVSNYEINQTRQEY
jgi:hypothetical protein